MKKFFHIVLVVVFLVSAGVAVASTTTSLKKANADLVKSKAAVKKFNASLSSYQKQQRQIKSSLSRNKKFLTQNQALLEELLKQDYQAQLRKSLGGVEQAKAVQQEVYFHVLEKVTDQRIASHIDSGQKLEAQLSDINKNIATATSQLSAQKAKSSALMTSIANYRKLLAKQIKAKKLAKAAAKKHQKKKAPIKKKIQAKSTVNPKTPFYNLKRKLPWPLTGKVLERFNSGGEMSKGIVVAGKRGQAIKAVAPGKVVFANVLRGYGLMAIVDNGSGYMTLYGDCQKLSVKVGQMVKAGQQIGTVGQRNSDKKPVLYFSVMRKGVAVDPLAWLS